MQVSRPLFAAAALLISTSLTAQASRTGGYSRSIGNSWLGGSVSVNTALSTSTSSRTAGTTTRTGRASLNAAATASVLTYNWTAARLDFAAMNTVTESVATLPRQSASGTFRVVLAGYTVSDRSVTTTGNLGGIPERTYNLFPSDVSAGVGVGPFTIRVSGNAGVTLGTGAMVILPTTTPEVRFLLSGSAAVLARASVAVGAAGFYAGLELRGRFAEQRLTVGLTANVFNGLSGSCYYELQGMSLRLVAYLEALWQRVYSTTLTSWSSGWVAYDLLNL
jgi:hypothetical protein